MSLLIANLEPTNYSPDARSILQTIGTITEYNGELQMEQFLQHADVLISRLGYRIDSSILNAAPNLSTVVCATTGVNHIDLELLSEKEITLISLKGETQFLSSITATAELHWGLLISLVRNLQSACVSVREGNWDRDKFKGFQLSGKTIGIIGYGRLGRIIATYAKAFRMKILTFDCVYSNSNDTFTTSELDDLLANSDVISINLSLNNSTKNFLNAERLRKLKAGALVVNTSRGEIVDEAALAELVLAGRINGVATDVLQGEATCNKDFLHTNQLWKLSQSTDRVLISPHIGGACQDAMHATEEFVARRLVKHVSSRAMK